MLSEQTYAAEPKIASRRSPKNRAIRGSAGLKGGVAVPHALDMQARMSLLAVVVAVGTVATAQAQRLVTIEEVRAAAETGIPPLITQKDANWFIDCGIPPIVPSSNAEIIRAQAESKAAGVNLQIIWIRHHLAEIEKCLAKAQ